MNSRSHISRSTLTTEIPPKSSKSYLVEFLVHQLTGKSPTKASCRFLSATAQKAPNTWSCKSKVGTAHICMHALNFFRSINFLLMPWRGQRKKYCTYSRSELGFSFCATNKMVHASAFTAIVLWMGAFWLAEQRALHTPKNEQGWKIGKKKVALLKLFNFFWRIVYYLSLSNKALYPSKLKTRTASKPKIPRIRLFRA